jgi:tRNA A-37 threonylcarbamoyl transferase component Bud32
MAKTWRIEPRFQDHPLADLLDSYQAADELALGRSGFKDWAERQTFPIEVNGKRFFIKHYRHRSSWWRALGRSRLGRERNNLAGFEAMGVPTTTVAAFGEDRVLGVYARGGILVTEGLDDCTDMHRLGEHEPQLFQDRIWFEKLYTRLASLLRRMHDTRFCHNDLNWRNVLIRTEGEFEIFIFDSPSGRRWPPPFLRFRRIKDLAHLDKLGRRYLSRTQRLRFYLAYAERTRLNEDDKNTVRGVLKRYRRSDNQQPRNIYELDSAVKTTVDPVHSE